MNFKYDILAIVSGPEPQRTIFESILIKELNKPTKNHYWFKENLSEIYMK